MRAQLERWCGAFVVLVIAVVGAALGCTVTVRETPPPRPVVYVPAPPPPPPPVYVPPPPSPPPPVVVVEQPAPPPPPVVVVPQPAPPPPVVVVEQPPAPAPPPVVVVEQPAPPAPAVVVETDPAPPQQQETVVVVAPAPQPDPATIAPETAQPVAVEVEQAPPPPQEETVIIAQRPSPGHVWIYGHWEWHHKWLWRRGHWETGRPGHVWVTGRWEQRGKHFHWVEGSFVVENQVAEEQPGLLVTTAVPPAPLHENVYIQFRPSARHVWIPGHWAWHGHWVWVHGHWHLGRAGNVWFAGRWGNVGGQWRWTAGHWGAEAQVAEEAPGELVATQAPPPPYNETIIVETRPSANHVWIHGHWSWHGHWVWEHGHWHVGRAGHLYVNGHWELAGGQYRWRAGSWVAEATITEERPGLLESPQNPPAPIHEEVIVALRPSPNHVWIGGHWAWHGHWVWEHGHWHPGRAGLVFRGGRWDNHGGRFHWTAGVWVRHR